MSVLPSAATWPFRTRTAACDHLAQSAQAEGRLTAVERDDRIAEAQAAEIFDDLVPLTRDLVSPTGPAARPLVNYDTANASDAADQIVAIFSGASRKHAWRVRRTPNHGRLRRGRARPHPGDVRGPRTHVQCVLPVRRRRGHRAPGTDVDSQVIAIFGGTEVGA